MIQCPATLGWMRSQLTEGRLGAVPCQTRFYLWVPKNTTANTLGPVCAPMMGSISERYIALGW